MRTMTIATGLLISFIITSAVATESNQGSVSPGLQLQALETKASSGNEKAQMKLAHMYLHGAGVSRDVEKAVA